MNFNKIFVVFMIVLAVIMGQAKADFWKDLGKRIERTGQNVRDALYQVVDLSQKAANVAATVRGDKKPGSD